MATVIQKPDSLSLLGNLKKYVISASQLVRFTLKRSQDIVIDESYTPINGTCEVDVKRVLETILQVALPTTQYASVSDFFLQYKKSLVTLAKMLVQANRMTIPIANSR